MILACPNIGMFVGEDSYWRKSMKKWEDIWFDYNKTLYMTLSGADSEEKFKNIM